MFMFCLCSYLTLPCTWHPLHLPLCKDGDKLKKERVAEPNTWRVNFSNDAAGRARYVVKEGVLQTDRNQQSRR